MAGLITVGVALRLLTLRSPGFPSDVGTFQAWAEHLVQVGPGGFYAPDYFSDYPPAYLYVLWLFGAVFDGELLRLAVKAASIPAEVVIAGAVLIELIRYGRWQPIGRVALAGVVTALALGAPFKAGPAELVDLVKKASETYPYTSLFAFNVWSIAADFWQPDTAYVGI